MGPPSSKLALYGAGHEKYANLNIDRIERNEEERDRRYGGAPAPREGQDDLSQSNHPHDIGDHHSLEQTKLNQDSDSEIHEYEPNKTPQEIMEDQIVDEYIENLKKDNAKMVKFEIEESKT